MRENEFDLHLATWLVDGPTVAPERVVEATLAHIEAHPRRRAPGARWGDAIRALELGRPSIPMARLAVLFALLALAVALAGIVYVGTQQRAVAPSPTPHQASVSACPGGSTPDRPGPASQERPPEDGLGPAAFDTGARRIVAADNMDRFVWTLDVCTNTWHRGPRYPLVDNDIESMYAAVYDPTLGVTVFIGSHLWTYDVRTDGLTDRGAPRSAEGSPLDLWQDLGRHLFYDPQAGALRAVGGTALWTYDPRLNAWKQDMPIVGERPPYSGQLFAYDSSAQRGVLYAISTGGSTAATTYEIDPRTATWSAQSAVTPRFPFPFGDMTGHRIAYDPANRRTVILANGRGGAYDASNDAWEEIDPFDRPQWADAIVYDAANERIVALRAKTRSGDQWSNDGVLAFDLRTREWSEIVPPAAAVPDLQSCPEGATPDRAGPADQARPADVTAATFDPRSGRLVALSREVTGGVSVWNFDVCTNTWHEGQARVPDGDLADDGWSDDVVVFAGPEVVHYSVGWDNASHGSDAPVAGAWAADWYDAGRGLFLVRDAKTSRIWTYDKSGDLWLEFRQQGDVPPTTAEFPAQSMSYDSSAGRLVLYVGRTWPEPRAATYEFDPATSTWSRPDTSTPMVDPTSAGLVADLVYDEASARTVLVSGGRLHVYDATSHVWEVVSGEAGSPAADRVGFALAYDSWNGRVLLVGGRSPTTGEPYPGDVLAFDLRTGGWLTLFASQGGEP